MGISEGLSMCLVNDVVAYGNDGLDVGRLAAVNDVFCRQQMGGVNGGGSDFVERDDENQNW